MSDARPALLRAALGSLAGARALEGRVSRMPAGGADA